MAKSAQSCSTYDDALNVHLDNVIPALDSLNLKGTFYLSGYFPAVEAVYQIGPRRQRTAMNWPTTRCSILAPGRFQEEIG